MVVPKLDLQMAKASLAEVSHNSCSLRLIAKGAERNPSRRLVAPGPNYRDWLNVCHLTLDPGVLLIGCLCHIRAFSLATKDHLECDSI